MDTTTTSTSQLHQNPNLDHHVIPPYCADHQPNHSMYYRIANYLMSDEDNDEKNLFSMDKDVDVDVLVPDDHYVLSDNVGGSLLDSFEPVTHNIKCRRELKKYDYNTHEGLKFAFRTKTDLDVMDDGYKWRKYGKKMMKNSPNPRNYYKCSYEGCGVKKRVEREREDPSYVITTYQGVHNHAS